jgi:hypothetical protein
MAETTYNSKLEILADLWLNYRGDEEFKDFIDYNDLGLPLSYLLVHNLVKGTEISNRFIDETFNLLLESLDIEDMGFENLDQLFSASEE